MDALEQENEDRIVGDLVRINLSEVIFTVEDGGMKECSLNFLRVCGPGGSKDPHPPSSQPNL